MQIEMNYKKATKNTYVFEATGTEVPTLYINKSAFEDQPKKIIVSIEVEK